MNFQPGQLDRQVVLKERTYTTDALGGRVPFNNTVATVWAMVEELGGEEKAAGRDQLAERRLRVTIRYYSGLKNTWLLEYGGELYEIVETPVEINRRQWHQIVCRRTGEQTYA